MTDEQRDTLAEARQYYLISPYIIPLLERRKRIAQETLIASYRGGERDLLAKVAELSALDALEKDIRQREAMYESANQTKEKS